MSTIENIYELCPSAYRLGGKDKKFRLGGSDLHTGTHRQAEDTWRVKNAELFNFLKVTEGFPPEEIDIGGGITFESYVPLRFPYLVTGVLADGYTVEGIGTPFGKNQYYEFYDVTITYSSPRYAIVGPTAMQSVSTGDGTKAIAGPGRWPIPIPGYVYSWTLHRVASFDMEKYRANSGTVNSVPWRNMPRGHTLFRSPVSSEEYLSDGSTSNTITLPIEISALEHNFEIDASGKLERPTFRDFNGMVRNKHLYVDFNILFGP